jgi:hypothetical protein
MIYSTKEFHVTWLEEPWAIVSYFVETTNTIFAHIKIDIITLLLHILFFVVVPSGSAHDVMSGLLYVTLSNSVSDFIKSCYAS